MAIWWQIHVDQHTAAQSSASSLPCMSRKSGFFSYVSVLNVHKCAKKNTQRAAISQHKPVSMREFHSDKKNPWRLVTTAKIKKIIMDIPQYSHFNAIFMYAVCHTAILQASVQSTNES